MGTENEQKKSFSRLRQSFKVQKLAHYAVYPVIVPKYEWRRNEKNTQP
jgi:hypothetical protein